MHQFSYRDNQLYCEGASLDQIADCVGTPAYVYSANTIRENYRRLHAALAPLDHLVCYAMKANSNLSVLKLLAGEGAGFDIVSGGELFRAIKSGGFTGHCTFAGVGKTVAEIEYALKVGIYSFNVESEEELERINHVAARHNLTAPVAVRVNPDVDAQTHKYISTGKSKNKFGIGLDRAAAVYERAAALPNLQIRGVQTHIGSQILDPQPFADAVKKLLPLVEELKAKYGIEFFSIGGGIGIVYDPALESGATAWWDRAAEQRRITPEAYARLLVPLLQPLDLKILLEPGRF
ncbi:MAG TPA: diaminopimelate decarboxylase, partial [Chthoniobacterales bacterium]